MTASCSAIILSASASLLLLLPVTLTRGGGGGCGCQACCCGVGSGMVGTAICLYVGLLPSLSAFRSVRALDSFAFRSLTAFESWPGAFPCLGRSPAWGRSPRQSGGNRRCTRPRSPLESFLTAVVARSETADNCPHRPARCGSCPCRRLGGRTFYRVSGRRRSRRCRPCCRT
jgi:hypothetical protein